MGITGLLPIVKPIMKTKYISSYKNSKIGIDGHAWLHQVVPAISYELYYGKSSDRHIKIFIEKISQLKRKRITPILIFDGDLLESKGETIKSRRALKAKYRVEIEDCLKKGDTGRARDLMKRIVDIKPELIHQILKELEKEGVEYIISPYEADAQLCYLQKRGYIDYIMTEDSDLIVFGASNILYKYNGSSIEEYQKKDLPKVKGDFFAENLLDIAILSGCDYVSSIKGVGLLTAHKRLIETKTIREFVEYHKLMNKPIAEGYLEDVAKAKVAFLFHIVYDPILKKRTYLNQTQDVFDFLGTLENIPYKINEKLTIPRHFRPFFSDEIKVTEIPFEMKFDQSLSIDIQKDENMKVDSNCDETLQIDLTCDESTTENEAVIIKE